MLLQISDPASSANAQEALASVKAIGIDLGTTNSAVAYAHNQQARVLKSAAGEALIPSVVSYQEQETLVGHAALALLESYPESVLHSAKRFMGQQQSPLPRTPIEISATILQTLKLQAEQALGESIESAVITVPAYFDEAGRQATKQAAELAGLKVLRLINEPTAAALAYGLEQEAEGCFAIYDLGGGTFDVSLLKLQKGVFQVLATGGDVALGGDDIDQAIVNYWQDKTLSPHPKHLLHFARKAKEFLSQNPQNVWSQQGFTLDNIALEKLAYPFVEQSLQVCSRVLQDARLSPADLTGVVLVGGSTRLPLIRIQVEHFFGQPPLTNLNPEEVVALGAALQAEALTHGSDTLLLDVTPLSLGLETMGGLVEKIIPRNSPLPVAIAQDFTTYVEGQTAMKIHVVQGERELVQDCRSLGQFTLQGIPTMAVGTARIRVTFTLDTDGLLTVSAQELTTGIHQEVQIKPNYGLSEEELLRVLHDNALHGTADIQQRLLIEIKIEAEHILHMLTTALSEDKHLLQSLELQSIEQAMHFLKQHLPSLSREEIQEKLHALNQLTEDFAQRRMEYSINKALKGRNLS